MSRHALVDNWHPRGEVTWPDWRDAKDGTRFEHTRTGRRGTFHHPDKNPHNGAIVTWDPIEIDGFELKARRSNVVAPAFDLVPLP
jgi:hypothetical protein